MIIVFQLDNYYAIMSINRPPKCLRFDFRGPEMAQNALAINSLPRPAEPNHWSCVAQVDPGH